jgi:hypothetical protein
MEVLMIDGKFLELLRAAIGAKNIPKKMLARKCKISKPLFSEFLHGDKPMPDEIKARLVAELGLQACLAKLMEPERVCKP